MKEKIGLKIKFLRKKQNLSLRKLGKKSNLHYMTIYKYETGQRSPRIENLKKIADALEVPLSHIIDDYPQEAKKNEK